MPVTDKSTTKSKKRAKAKKKDGADKGTAHLVKLKSGDTYEASHVVAQTYKIVQPWGHEVIVDADAIESIDDYEVEHEAEHTIET